MSAASIAPAVQRFVGLPPIAEPLKRLRLHLPPTATVYIVGGALRNLIIDALFGNSPATADIDVFIGGIAKDYSFNDLLKDQACEHTELGGMRWWPSECPYAFDLCALAQFVFFEKYQLPPTLQNLLACIDFNVNAVVFDTQARQLHEKGCISAIAARCMDFNTTRMLNRLMLAYRILLIRHKTGFLLSAPVFSYVKHQIDLATLKNLKGLLQKKAGKAMAKAVMADYDEICSYKDYAAYSAAYRYASPYLDG